MGTAGQEQRLTIGKTGEEERAGISRRAQEQRATELQQEMFRRYKENRDFEQATRGLCEYEAMGSIFK